MPHGILIGRVGEGREIVNDTLGWGFASCSAVLHAIVDSGAVCRRTAQRATRIARFATRPSGHGPVLAGRDAARVHLLRASRARALFTFRLWESLVFLFAEKRRGVVPLSTPAVGLCMPRPRGSQSLGSMPRLR